MTDILLTHSYFLRFDPKEFRAMTPYPPLGTLIAAAVLRNDGMRVAFHDVMFSGREDEIVPVLTAVSPKAVVIYDDSFNYLTKMCLSRMREAAFRLARHAREAGCTTIVFSSDATDHLREYFAHDVDYVICGEAEQTLNELSRFLTGRDPSLRPDQIDGLAFVRNGAIVQTKARALIRDLDVLPFPAWDLVDLEQYRSRWMNRHGYFSINLSTTRGCPFHCNWCAKPIYGQVYNSRSPEHVVQEMKYLKEAIRPDHVWITDDIFGLKPGWIRTFAEAVNRENARIPFKCLSRVDLLLKENAIRDLARAGCQTVWVGAESGSQKILDAMDKGTTVEEIREATIGLRDAGIRVGFFLQFGYPGETREDIEATLELVRECVPDEIGISVSYPLPGTPFYDRVRAQMDVKQNWETSDDFDPMFRAAYSREYYRRLHTVVHKKFRIWRGRRALRAIFAGPRIPGPKALKMIASMVLQAATLPLELKVLEQLERKSAHGTT